MARETTARVRHGAEATWQSRGWPTRGAGGAQGANTWQEATRVHGSTRMPVWGATWQERVGIWRAHKLVGLGMKFGAATQMRYRALTFKLNISRVLFRVGLCSRTSYLLLATWTFGRRRIPSRWRRSRGPEYTRSSNQARAQNVTYVTAIERLTGRHVAT